LVEVNSAIFVEEILISIIF